MGFPGISNMSLPLFTIIHTFNGLHPESKVGSTRDRVWGSHEGNQPLEWLAYARTTRDFSHLVSLSLFGEN